MRSWRLVGRLKTEAIGLAAVVLLLAAGPARSTAADAGIAPALRQPSGGPPLISVTSRQSQIHLGSLDSFDITPAGTRAARMLLDHFDNGRPEAVQAAISIYEMIIPKENFGGEYTALKWLAECLLADGPKKQQMLADRYVAEFYAFLTDNKYERLKEYLKRKYHIEQLPDDGTHEAKRRQRFHEDFILFDNPYREQWEKSSKILDVVGLKPGQSVADVGCGPGYFSFRFAEQVGPAGRVYSVDTNEEHIAYMKRLIAKYGIQNVIPRQTFAEDCEIGVSAQVDCVFMCSLYHVLYATLTEEERDVFVGSIRNVLKPGGRLIVVDNGLVEDRTLPYHGPYISKDLVTHQLYYYGFKLVGSHQFIPQRYVLVFEKTEIPPPAVLSGKEQFPAECVPVTSKASLVYVLTGGRDTGFTVGGRNAAKILYKALETKDPATLREAIAAYDKLVPKERFGDEYTALQWFCEYLLAPEASRQQMLDQPYVADYFALAAADDFALLKKYLVNKYYLDAEEIEDARPPEQRPKNPRLNLKLKPATATEEEVITWGEIFTYANPTRERWERTGRILECLKIKPGDTIGDVGCGAGYYSFKFAKAVGSQGRVLAVDTNKVVLEHMMKSAQKSGLPIEPVLTRDNDTKLPPKSCDLVFMCTMYHAVYVTSIEYVKDQFMASIKQALKPGGRLAIVDNSMLKASENPFYGPRIAKELIISQMKHYGFKLVSFEQIIPQRYVLLFEQE